MSNATSPKPQLVRDRILSAFADQFSVKVTTFDQKLFTFWAADGGGYLGCAHTIGAACAWMRGFGMAKGLYVGTPPAGHNA